MPQPCRPCIALSKHAQCHLGTPGSETLHCITMPAMPSPPPCLPTPPYLHLHHQPPPTHLPPRHHNTLNRNRGIYVCSGAAVSSTPHPCTHIASPGGAHGCNRSSECSRNLSAPPTLLTHRAELVRRQRALGNPRERAAAYSGAASSQSPCEKAHDDATPWRAQCAGTPL